MDMGSAILIIGSAALVAAFLLLVIGLVYSELMNSDIPRGVANSRKLHMVHGLFVSFISCIFLSVLCTWLNPAPAVLQVTDQKYSDVALQVYTFLFKVWENFVAEVCQHLAKESDTTEVSVGCQTFSRLYRLASEHGCPADTSVYSHKVAVGGDSPWANLAATLCQRLARSEERHLLFPCAQVLIHPALQKADFNLPSYQQNHAVPILFRGRMAFCFLQNLNGHISVSQDVLESYHVPTKPRPRYERWLSPSNLPPGWRLLDDRIIYRRQLLLLEKEGWLSFISAVQVVESGAHLIKKSL
uniref:Arylacetamide deacetylase-like 4 n=1 Tax=Labrus bergylta TaxID=56723 RepID=A0A3Q3GR59_9LABR